MTLAERHWHEFATPESLAEAFAARIAALLALAIDERGQALLAVSGGTTPKLLFQVLSRQAIDWTKVTLTLVDERFAAPDSDRSNEHLARQNLLQNKATRANFVGLYNPAETIEAAADHANTAVASLAFPFDLVILGMGGDGHTASFFPDAAELPTLLDPGSTRNVLAVHAQSAGEPRLTFSLARLVAARHIALHIQGADKKATLEAALSGGSGPPKPIRSVFEQSKRPIDVLWAPETGAS